MFSTLRLFATQFNRATPFSLQLWKRPFTSKKLDISKASNNNERNYYARASEDVLFTVAALGDQEARIERLLREIMSTKNIERPDALLIFGDIVKANRRGLYLALTPYYTGITVSIISAIVSIPMIFSLNTVLWFNNLFVTSDVPEPKDLETFLEVGSWAWLGNNVMI